MSGIAVTAFEAVSQIKVLFVDDLGNQKLIFGTGFWISVNNTRFFVTNRHNFDATIKLRNETTYRPHELQIRLRRVSHGVVEPVTQRVIDRVFEQETQFFQVSKFEESLISHPAADVAVLREPVFENLTDGFSTRLCFDIQDIADDSFFNQVLRPMDSAAFIGFPGSRGKGWWDENWGFPIVRSVGIASIPAFTFTNASIPTTEVTLVTGLSFSGSSGSPIISYEKGIQVAAPPSGGNYVPPKVIGIMSGHWNEEPTPDQTMFFHSGLSYFTRSTAILKLLNSSTAT